MGWLIAILTLSLLIVIHEYGHYVCARIGGMHVDRFSVLGIGPVAVTLGTWRGTEFVISWVPFGAYVHIVGMEPEEELEPDENGELPEPPPPPVGFRNFRDSPVWARALAISGGPLANYLTAMVICTCIFGFVGINRPNQTGIKSFAHDSPAHAACLEQGDVYVSIAGESVQGENPRQLVISATKDHLGETVPIVVDRDGQRLSFDVPLNDKPPALGAAFRDQKRYEAVDPWTAVKDGVAWPLVQTANQLTGLKAMITGESKGEVGGPSSIIKEIKHAWEEGPHAFMLMVALISTALGMFNILPLPALDGGRLMFMLYEIVFRKPANKIVEMWVHSLGILLLLGFIGFVELRALYRAVDGDDAPAATEAATPDPADRDARCASAGRVVEST